MRSQKLGMNVSAAETVLYQRMPVELLQRVVNFLNERKYHSRTEAVNDLLDVALTVISKLDTIQDPELVAELKAQLHEGGVVHYIQSLNPNQLEVLWSIVDNEMKSRHKNWTNKIGGKK